MGIFRLLLNQASRSSRLLSLNFLRIVSACYFKQATLLGLSSLSPQFLIGSVWRALGTSYRYHPKPNWLIVTYL